MTHSHCLRAGQSVYSVRFRCGKQLSKEASVDADLVSTVPESATPAAMGYAKQVCVGEGRLGGYGLGGWKGANSAGRV